MNRPFARALLASAAVAAAIALAGCDPDEHCPDRPRARAALRKDAGRDDGEEYGQGVSDPGPHLQGRSRSWRSGSRTRDGQFALLKTYPICRWSGDLGPKKKEGDRQAPEGFYTITPGQMNPNSNYYLAFNTGFPNAYDRAMGYTGSELMVHGDCSSRGCYAMTDEQIQEIYALARESFFGGQKSFQLQAYPFRMTAMNMAKHRNNPNFAFWKMLKEGYDHFEATHQEPKVAVCERRYVFDAGQPRQFLAAAIVQCESRNCPAYQLDKNVADAVQRSQRQEQRKMAEYIASGVSTVAVPHRCRRRHEPGVRRQALAAERIRQQRPSIRRPAMRRAWRAAARSERAGRAAAHRYSHSPAPSAEAPARPEPAATTSESVVVASVPMPRAGAAAKAGRSARYAADHDRRADRQSGSAARRRKLRPSAPENAGRSAAPIPTWQQSPSQQQAAPVRAASATASAPAPVHTASAGAAPVPKPAAKPAPAPAPAVASCQSRAAASARNSYRLFHAAGEQQRPADRRTAGGPAPVRSTVSADDS